MRKFAALSTILFALGCVLASALDDSAKAANRRTALRCLNSAKDSASVSDWAAVVSYAKMGLSYDESVADLWYLEAAASSRMGAKNFEVLPLVERSLAEGMTWVDYNKDNARVLYADILSDTGSPRKAIEVLAEAPQILSADAEFIRIKSLYRLGTKAELDAARAKADSCRKIYPYDTRFPLLFFSSERLLLRKAGILVFEAESLEPAVRSLSAAFIRNMPSYRISSPRLQVLAAMFAPREEKVRMLKAFAAAGNSDPLYPQAALMAGLMSEREALAAIAEFADEQIGYSELADFALLLKEEEVRSVFGEYLVAFGGILDFDLDGDMETDMTVRYKRGRPEFICCDTNQDGMYEWTLRCDFGVPVQASVSNQKLNLEYLNYPAVKTARYDGERKFTFNLVDDTLRWTPAEIVPDQKLRKALGADFYVPVPTGSLPITDDVLSAAASSYEVPSDEREGAVIEFVMLNGSPQEAVYRADGRIYARMQFSGGHPDIRMLDSDGDGIFETTEKYARSEVGAAPSSAEDSQVTQNLFGIPHAGSGYYVSMISVDRNGDTCPNFTEEYQPSGGRIASWDNDSDGLWEVRYVRYPDKGDGRLEEDAMFYLAPRRERVTVRSLNGVPVSVQADSGIEFDVLKDDALDFYWIGKKGASERAERCVAALNEVKDQGVSLITDRILAVRIGSLYLGRIIEEVW